MIATRPKCIHVAKLASAWRVRPNPSLERTSTGKALGPRGVRHIIRLAAQAPCRWRPLSSNVRPARSLRWSCSGVSGKQPTANKTPVPLRLCRWCSDDPNDVQRPLRVRVKTLVPRAPAPQILLSRPALTAPPARLRRVAGLSQVRLTAPARMPAPSPGQPSPLSAASQPGRCVGRSPPAFAFGTRP
jgi:hypothetical protein